MKKKLVCLILVVAILCASSISYAGSSNTTTDDSGYSVSTNNNGLQITFSKDTQYSFTDFAVMTLLSLMKFDSNHPLIDYFDDDIKEKLKELLPEGCDLKGLARYQFLSLKAEDFQDMGDGKAMTLKFPISCKEGTEVVAVFGVPDSTAPNGIRWITVKAKVVNGEIIVYLSDEDLELLRNAKEIIMTIMALREKVENKEDIIVSPENPSITTDDFGYSISYNTEIMYIDIRIELPHFLTSLADSVLGKLGDHAKNNSIMSFFNDLIKKLASDLLPEGTNLDDLEMNEFLSLKALVFDFGLADVVDVDLTFPTEYEDGRLLFAMIGVKDLTEVTSETNIDEEIMGIKWFVLPAIVVNGVVRIQFTREVLMLIDASHNEIMLGIFSVPK